ncbi:putative UDP-rhamnose:rhamnosyltransferase 1 [Mercurialis annua]|uniref:putative UDP-rhamnose:rhamnosyltransferase 1 n=1 Tax=Mercurialis annua TaxID=3986 RepID=UPI00215E344E|nr:putative UDP-rhamnose:rhamnosyltransferase 1 [Mercurialis annua]
MFPWLAFGHLTPFLELSKQITQKGHKISFISTSKNIDRLPKLPPHLASSITFVKLPLPYVDNLPKNAEATSDLTPHDVCYLKKSYDCLREPLSEFLESSLPDFILFDFVSYWVPDIARKLQILSVYFSIFLASTLCYLSSGNSRDHHKHVEDYIVAPNWVPFPSKVAHRLFEVLRVFNGTKITVDEFTIPEYNKRFQDSMNNCDLIAVRTCQVFEPEWLKLAEHLPNFPLTKICNF